MHVPGSAADVGHTENPEHTPLTPRGMAAPPPPRDVRRFDGDPTRPATIRIEANVRTPILQRGDPELDPSSDPPRAVTAPARSRERLQGLFLSQGLLLNAFVMLLVFGWSSPLPGRRILLCAFALGGIVIAALIHVALRNVQSRASAGAPRRNDPMSASGWLAAAAIRALPAALVAGWIALGLYALALPPSANAFEESRGAPKAPANATAASRPAARGTSAPAPAQSGDSGSTKERAEPQTAKRSLFKW